jgi:hypothetical protein
VSLIEGRKSLLYRSPGSSLESSDVTSDIGNSWMLEVTRRSKDETEEK